MKIAFYKNGTSTWAKIISWWTKTIYTHCELVFEDKTAFSANTNSIKNFGTRFIKFDYDTYDPKYWEVIDLPINTYEEQKIKDWCKTEDNCFYDLVGIFLTQIIPLSFENPWWWFCSEVCLASFQKNLGWFKGIKAHEIDPGELRKMIIKKIESSLYS